MMKPNPVGNQNSPYAVQVDAIKRDAALWVASSVLPSFILTLIAKVTGAEPLNVRYADRVFKGAQQLLTESVKDKVAQRDGMQSNPQQLAEESIGLGKALAAHYLDKRGYTAVDNLVHQFLAAQNGVVRFLGKKVWGAFKPELNRALGKTPANMNLIEDSIKRMPEVFKLAQDLAPKLLVQIAKVAGVDVMQQDGATRHLSDGIKVYLATQGTQTLDTILDRYKPEFASIIEEEIRKDVSLDVIDVGIVLPGVRQAKNAIGAFVDDVWGFVKEELIRELFGNEAGYHEARNTRQTSLLFTLINHQLDKAAGVFPAEKSTAAAVGQHIVDRVRRVGEGLESARARVILSKQTKNELKKQFYLQIGRQYDPKNPEFSPETRKRLNTILYGIQRGKDPQAIKKMIDSLSISDEIKRALRVFKPIAATIAARSVPLANAGLSHTAVKKAFYQHAGVAFERRNTLAGMAALNLANEAQRKHLNKLLDRLIKASDLDGANALIAHAKTEAGFSDTTVGKLEAFAQHVFAARTARLSPDDVAATGSVVRPAAAAATASAPIAASAKGVDLAVPSGRIAQRRVLSHEMIKKAFYQHAGVAFERRGKSDGMSALGLTNEAQRKHLNKLLDQITEANDRDGAEALIAHAEIEVGFSDTTIAKLEAFAQHFFSSQTEQAAPDVVAVVPGADPALTVATSSSATVLTAGSDRADLPAPSSLSVASGEERAVADAVATTPVLSTVRPADQAMSGPEQRPTSSTIPAAATAAQVDAGTSASSAVPSIKITFSKPSLLNRKGKSGLLRKDEEQVKKAFYENILKVRYSEREKPTTLAMLGVNKEGRKVLQQALYKIVQVSDQEAKRIIENLRLGQAAKDKLSEFNAALQR